MTPQAQRIAIAEALGKRVLRSCGDQDSDHKHQEETPKNSIGAWIRWCRDCDAKKVCSIHGDERFWDLPNSCEDGPEDAPDYPNDLNAMHEAEKTLEDKRDYTGRCAATNRYCWELEKLCKPFNDQPPYICSYPWHASAAQRAEAFLRTLGKWE